MKKNGERPCANCGKGVVRLESIEGRTFPYKDDPDVVVDADLKVLVCDTCGDMVLSPAMSVALDEVLESTYREKRIAQQRKWIDELCAQGLTQQEIERIGSFSPGYASKLRTSKVASPQTYRLLYVLHELPEETLRAVGKLDWRIRQISRRRATRIAKPITARSRNRRRAPR